jgi:hypothetical protein
LFTELENNPTIMQYEQSRAEILKDLFIIWATLTLFAHVVPTVLQYFLKLFKYMETSEEPANMWIDS